MEYLEQMVAREPLAQPVLLELLVLQEQAVLLEHLVKMEFPQGKYTILINRTHLTYHHIKYYQLCRMGLSKLYLKQQLVQHQLWFKNF
jgi:hypothetical protein